MQETNNVKKLELYKRDDHKYKMIIPPAVEEKIRLACASVPNLEWSGVLFFTYTGKLSDGSLKVTCEDILVMDIGTATYTEWCADAEVIRYMAENDLLDCQMALVHSHNNMATFFSGTDTATLLAEGQDRNNVVSLIVNNAGVYSAAITRHVYTEAEVHEKGKYQFFGDGEESYEDTYTTEDEYIEYFMFDIVRKEPNKLFSFINRLKEVMARKRTTVTATQSTSTPAKYGGHYGYYGGGQWSTPASPKPATPTVAPAKPATPITPVASKAEKPTSPIKPAEPATPVKHWFDDWDDLKSIENDNMDLFIEDLALQVVTGNVFAGDEGLIDLEEYVDSEMYKAYNKRFGVDTSSNSDFAAWLDSILEFIIYNSHHPEINDYGLGDQGEIIASELKKKLEKLPKQNIYLKEIIKHLGNYE